ncbi:HAD family hydrolase [Candidatus Woesearchaeota archaeon]|nr:HAD family hydrolase [Candidatus Woesearchaeota archaeon]
MVKKKLKLTDKQLDQKAKELGLEKNKFNRWDTGDLCRELKLLEEYYKVLEDQIQVLPVLHEPVINSFLRLKKQKKTIAIISNSMLRTIKAYVNKYKLNKYVDFIYSRDDAGCKKNEEVYWKNLIKKQKLKIDECLVIGDDQKQDIVIPQKLGFKTFLIKNSADLNSL